MIFAFVLFGSSTSLALVSAFVANSAKQNPPEGTSEKVAGTSNASEEVAKYFPFHIGSSWTYSFKQSMEEGSGAKARTRTVRGHYSETVVSLEQSFDNSIQLVGVRRDGEPPSYVSCPVEKDFRSSDRTKPEFWYVTGRLRVFVVCTREDATQLVLTLGNSPSGEISNYGPDYVLPFKLGGAWGADPDYPRDDNFYEWAIVDQGDITVPAGKYKGCFSIIFRTLPDHEIRDICPGVGLVADEYEHHGTLDEHRIELTNYSRGAVRKAR
jgi:hypothetical protein